jgi:hypothetical protein
MKETKELMAFAAQAVNAGYTIAADGQINLGDLAALFPLVLAGQNGIGGVKLVGAEQGKIGDREKAEIRAAMAEKLSNVPAEQRGDWLDATIGILSVYRLGRMAAKTEAAKSILDRIRKGESIDEIEKAYKLQ